MEESSLSVTDKQSAAVQKTENRVTLESMEKAVESVEYFNPKTAPQMTVAFVKFNNGYVVIGESAPADPANFNEELGKKFAREGALRKAWPLFGFALCNAIAEKAAA